ncbi:MAG TPA: deaminase, partial [Polyangiaceae bacterium]|nr:deaminase [Polyangiaceae bacterium]
MTNLLWTERMADPAPPASGPATTPPQAPSAPLSATAVPAPAAQTRAPRADWDSYFMAIAREVATRSTCDRKHVGALVVVDRRILATGYNGSIRGLAHCDDVGHLIVDGHCVRTVHAESNAIVQAAQNGVRLEGATLYVTASPCFNCFKLVAAAGIQRIVFGEFYREHMIFDWSK